MIDYVSTWKFFVKKKGKSCLKHLQWMFYIRQLTLSTIFILIIKFGSEHNLDRNDEAWFSDPKTHQREKAGSE